MLAVGSGLGLYLTISTGCWMMRELGLIDDVWRWWSGAVFREPGEVDLPSRGKSAIIALEGSDDDEPDEPDEPDERGGVLMVSQSAIDTSCRLRQLAARCGLAVDDHETPVWRLHQADAMSLEWGWALLNSSGEAHYFGVEVKYEYCVEVRDIGAMDFLEALKAAEDAAGIPSGVRDYSQDVWHETLPEANERLYRRVN
tara:strand:+ start:52 stop:648 length:597 start_codon:yes stop_codon:yes gene_type:complete